ncbi:MAG: M28 family metallopeptidase [Candidatus Kapaibacterium sp.]
MTTVTKGLSYCLRSSATTIATSLAIMCLCFVQTSMAQDAVKYKDTARRIIATATADSSLYDRLATMCDTFGSRLSGSGSLEQAIDWIIAEARKEGYNARGEEAKVPHWVRGEESCTMISPRKKNMAMLGLGGTIATPAQGVTADVLVVSSFEELKRRAAEVPSKIVLYNVPFTEYGKTVQYRVQGAIEAARLGAVASLVRSVGPYGINTPHTGGMAYNDSVPKIPHAAITIEDAEMIHRMVKRGQKVQVTLRTSGRWEPDALSRNIVFEIPGSEKPNEVVVMGGHIDSWDVGQGAMDDGGGCFAAWHALNTIKKLGLKPKRTIRVVMFTNEENGLRGGKAYAAAHGNETHVLAIESDEGTFKPKGFHHEGSKQSLQWYQGLAPLLESIGATDVVEGFGGADIGPLNQEYGTNLLGLQVDGTRYFWYHHTHGDTMDKLNPRELNECAAAMAIMAFVAADADNPPIGSKSARDRKK